MTSIFDVGALKDAAARLGAIDEYLNRTSTEGRKQVQETMRRLEARCGWLLGQGIPGAHSSATEGAGLSKDERHAFRKMAANPEVVEQVIAASTDARPPSRSKVLGAIDAKAVEGHPRLVLAAQISKGVLHSHQALLVFSAADVAAALDEDQMQSLSDHVSDLDEWLLAIKQARPRGLRIVGGK